MVVFANLKLKPSKCFICRRKLLYLGHEISKDGVGPDPLKVKAMASIPIPSSKTDVRSALGVFGYFRNSFETLPRELKLLPNSLTMKLSLSGSKSSKKHSKT